jgi:hypothetical protein
MGRDFLKETSPILKSLLILGLLEDGNPMTRSDIIERLTLQDVYVNQQAKRIQERIQEWLGGPIGAVTINSDDNGIQIENELIPNDKYLENLTVLITLSKIWKQSDHLEIIPDKSVMDLYNSYPNRKGSLGLVSKLLISILDGGDEIIIKKRDGTICHCIKPTGLCEEYSEIILTYKVDGIPDKIKLIDIFEVTLP